MPDPYRYMSPAILGTILYICPAGSKVGDVIIGPNALPALPTDSAAGGWLSLGEIKSAKIVPTRKEVKVEGYNRRGGYHNIDLSYNQEYKLQIQTQWLTPEALQLTYGSVSSLVNDTADLVPYTAAGCKIDGWLYHSIHDVLADNKELLGSAAYGSLRLTNPVNVASDPVLCDWEQTIDSSNILNTLNPVALLAQG